MRTAAMKRVITIIAMSMLICMCYAVIQGSVYADQSNQENFRKNYTLSGNGADDIVAVAMAQYGQHLVNDLGYINPGLDSIYFISDCADLAGQTKAVPKPAPCDSRYLATLIFNRGGHKVTTPQKGDVVYLASSDPGFAGIMINDYACIAGRRVNGSFFEVHIYLVDSFCDYGIRSDEIKYIRPNYKNNPPVTSPLVVKGKTIKVSYSKLRKKSQVFKVSKALTIRGYKSGLTYKKIKGNSKIKINAKTGKVTVKKKLKKKTYKVTVRVTAKNAHGKTLDTAKATFKVRVR